MTILDWIVLGIIILLFILAMRHIVISNKKGRNGCNGCCSCCSGCSRKNKQ